MGAKKYIITPDYDTIVAQFLAALTDFYGAGVTIHYASTPVIIFSCAAISDKIIKLSLVSAELDYSYGDVWTSGTTITNEVFIQNQTWTACITDFILILSDNFLLFLDTNTSDPNILILAKTTNNTFLALCPINSTNTGYAVARFSYETGSDTRIYPLAMQFGCDVKHPDNYLLKMPFLFIDAGLKLMLNGDGTPLTISGLYITSSIDINIFDSDDIFVYSGYLMLHNYNIAGISRCGLLVELDSGV